MHTEEQFEIEKRAKLQAILFILNKGLLQDYQQFCKDTESLSADDLLGYTQELLLTMLPN